MKYISQKVAQTIDEALTETYKFTFPQLIELAGLSVAKAVCKYYPSHSHTNVLVCVGPGNNGADGLVAARNLRLFGYNVDVFCPKPSSTAIFQNFLNQLSFYDLSYHRDFEKFSKDLKSPKYHVVVDALLGFGFVPPLRSPFLEILNELSKTDTPIASVDVPSGWKPDEVPSHHDKESLIKPSLLISLTAPKLCAQDFKGQHVVGGRLFVPPVLCREFELEFPELNDNEINVVLG